MKKNTTKEALKAEMNKPVNPSAHATNAMRPAIIAKALEGRTKAITLKMAEDAGVTKERLDDWKTNVQSLYDAACEYHESLDTEDEAQAEQRVWDVWRRIIAVGNADALSPKMFIRRKDVENIRVYATGIEAKHVQGVGFVGTYTGVEKFRGIIEVRLALRIAGNAILQDADREIMDKYQKAVRTVKKCNDEINGYTRGKTVVASLASRIADAQASLDAVTEALKAAGVKNVEELTSKQTQAVQILKDELKKATTRRDKFQKVINDLQKEYDEIVNTLDSIEDSATAPYPAPVPKAERMAKMQAAIAAAEAK